jgi:hypothetical protein
MFLVYLHADNKLICMLITSSFFQKDTEAPKPKPKKAKKQVVVGYITKVVCVCVCACVCVRSVSASMFCSSGDRLISMPVAAGRPLLAGQICA